MNQPMMGTMTMVKRVSCHEMKSRMPKYPMMRMGFLKSMSRLDMMEFSISCTSPLMRAMMSPLRSSEKKPSDCEVIFL